MKKVFVVILTLLFVFGLAAMAIAAEAPAAAPKAADTKAAAPKAADTKAAAPKAADTKAADTKAAAPKAADAKAADAGKKLPKAGLNLPLYAVASAGTLLAVSGGLRLKRRSK